MENLAPVPILACTQCGGELHPDEGQSFLTCPYCSTTVYLDKSQVVFHWYLAPTLDENKARSALARWMSGNETVKDLDKKARLVSLTFEYFPFWLFKRRTGRGKEEILMEPASAISISELKRLKLMAGDLKKYDSSLNALAETPSVPLTAALGWLEERSIPVAEIVERSLVHVPLFVCKYQFRDGAYTAIVEGATGGVYANIFPAKAESPYLIIGGIGAAVYFCLATFPVLGGLFSSAEGFGIGLALCSVLGIIVAPILFIAASWVANKI